MWSCENLRPHQISRPPAGCAGASHPALHAEFTADYGWFSKKGVPINDVRRSDKGKWTPARVAPATPCCLPPAAPPSAARRRQGTEFSFGDRWSLHRLSYCGSAPPDWQESGQQVLTGAYTQTRRPAHKRRRHL